MFKLCFSLLIVTFSLFSHLSNAECCYKKQITFYSYYKNCEDYQNGNGASRFDKTDPGACKIKVCGDGKAVIKGTFCGKGSCNMFGCNCKGGCIQGDAVESFMKLHQGEISLAKY